MTIVIDEQSGCCNGVVRAIKRAEEQLQSDGMLYCLGSIVHNSAELARLKKRGLKVIDYTDLEQLRGETVLFRAHGEPPSVYRLSNKNNIKIIDCTCPVVLQLQKKIATTYQDIMKDGGQIVIFGKIGHAEVNGLVGQVDGNAIVIEKREDLGRVISSGELNISKPISLFSQTTKDPSQYEDISSHLISVVRNKGIDISNITIHNTICRQVSSRHPHLISFSKENDVVLFVCGKDSSNGKVLFELCKSVNPRTFMVEAPEEIKSIWFQKSDKVGITGATSTPKWQIDDIAKRMSLM